jgi:4a-hydroxytetrahydrobiopterin dehydratase
MKDMSGEEDTMATLLDDRLVSDAMENLDEWSGDAQRITRTLRIEDVDGLLAAVAEAADALDHHPEVERDGDSVTFTLWTHSAGGVTELDIALAARINDLVLATQHLQRDASGELHSVVGAPTDDGAVEGRTVTADPNFPTPGKTTPSRPAESTTGDPHPSSGSEGRDAPTMNEPSTPRQDAGMIVVPDAEPGSVEPQPGNAAAPGMHENTDAAD